MAFERYQPWPLQRNRYAACDGAPIAFAVYLTTLLLYSSLRSVSACRAAILRDNSPILEGVICIEHLLNGLKPHSTVARAWVIGERLSYALEVAGGKLGGKRMVTHGASGRFGDVAHGRRAPR
jgi:hypothetical protein